MRAKKQTRMALQRSDIADKIIVDRRNARRNSDVARAVRMTRERLSQQPGTAAFERELLKLHARAMASGTMAIPLMVVVIAPAALFAGMGSGILIWALLTLVCHVGLAFVAQRTAKAEGVANQPRLVMQIADGPPRGVDDLQPNGIIDALGHSVVQL